MKEFNLLGHTIEFDDNLEYYSEVRKFYSNIMDHVLEIYEKSWNESCGNIHAVMLMFPASVEVITKQLAKVACDRLIAQYIYDMDEDIFCSYYEDEYFKTPSFDDIYEVYMTALEIMNGDTLSRNNRKIDFDELTDEVANFVYNRYEEGKSSSKQKRPMNRLEREFEKEFEKLYTEELYENLKDDIRCLCLGGMHAYLNELCDHDMFEYPDFDYEKADTIYLNTLKHAEGDVVIRNLIKCIRLYPLRVDYYVTLYNMPCIDDETAETIEEMVKTLDMYGEFYNATIEMRVKRWQTRFLNLINENKNATIVEKAEIVKRFFAEEYYRCDFYDDKDGKKILEYINTQVKAISEEILKYGKGSDTKEKLEFYCKENNLSDEEKLNFDIVLCSYEIIDKYPFFIVLDEEDYYLKSTDEYMDLLELIEKLCEKIEDEALTSIPDIVSGKIEDGLLKTWMMDIHTVEKIEAFSLVHEKFKIVFEKEVIDSDQIKNKKKNAEKTESCLSEIKKIYDNILSNGQSINLNVFEEFIKDIKKYKLNESLSPEVRSYKQKIINAFIDYCESKPVEELLGIQDILLKYDDDYITNEPEWVIDLYSNKLKSSYSFLTIMKYGKTSSLLILEDLYEKESSRKILELKIKAEDLYAQLKKFPGYYSKKSKLFDTSVKTLVSYCDDKVSENDICAVYMSEALSFLVTKEGFVCLRGSESKDVRYIKYSDIKYINQMEGGFVCLVLKEDNEKIMFTDAGEKDTVSDLFEFISEFLIYLYDLPTGYVNLYKYKKQIDEVAGLMQGIEKKNIEQLNRILKDLKKYPKKISEEAIEKVQELCSERLKKIKIEFEKLVSGEMTNSQTEKIITEVENLPKGILLDICKDKTEEELKNVLVVLKKYPKIKNTLSNIQKIYDEKVYERNKTQLNDITKNYKKLNPTELECVLSKLNKEYKDVPLANEYIQAVKSELIKKKDIAIREKVSLNTVKLETFTRVELEGEYNEWVSYTGKVIEARDYLKKIEELIKRRYVEEANEMCANLENLSLEELEHLLSDFNSTFTDMRFTGYIEENKKRIKEEINKKKTIAIKSEIAEDNEKLASLSKSSLDEIINKWAKYVNKYSEAKELVEAAKKLYVKLCEREADEICENLANMSIDELEKLNIKVDNEFYDSQFDYLKERIIKAIKSEIKKKKDDAVREDITRRTSKLNAFTRVELESEYNEWVGYTGKVTEVREYLKKIEELIERRYVEEANEMCGGLEKLSLDEIKQLLSNFDSTFTDVRFIGYVAEHKKLINEELNTKKIMALKSDIAKDNENLESLSRVSLDKIINKWAKYVNTYPEAKELIDSAKTYLVKAQERELKEWLPDDLDKLSEQELNSYITKYDSQNYDTSLYSVYLIPLIEKRNGFIAEKVEMMSDYIRTKAVNFNEPINFVQKDIILQDLSQQTESYADTMVCSIGKMPEACKIYTKKFVCGQIQQQWEKIASFEFKKKFFGSSLYCHYKNGLSKEIKISLVSGKISDMVGVLNDIRSYICCGGNGIFENGNNASTDKIEATAIGTNVQQNCLESINFENNLPSTRQSYSVQQISLSKSEPDKPSEKKKISLEKEISGEHDRESADKALNSENISGDDIALKLHSEIKNAGNKKIIKFVEFLTKGSILEGKSSFVSKYIYDELCDKDKVDSDDIPIVRIRDSVSQSMYEADAESLEGILIMSNKVIYYKDAKYVTVPISSSTEFHIKKKWLGSELRLNDVNIDYALDEAYDEEDFAKFLNKVLDIIRKSEFHQTSKETSDVTNESVSEGMTDIAPKTDNKLGMMSQVKHSSSEAVNFVNNLPSEMRAKIIGTANPKFSKKVKNAIKAYASNVKESEVIALYDDTVFGSAKEGFIMTTDRIIVRYSATTSNCMYSEIKGFEINYNARLSLTSIYIQTLNGLTKISGVMDEAECKVMANGINEIVKYLYGLDENPYSIEIN